MERLFEIAAIIMVRFTLVSIFVERALYILFDGKGWKHLEKKIDGWLGGDFLDLKPLIAKTICIWLAFDLNYDIYAELFSKDAGVVTTILTGLFLAGGSKGAFKAMRRMRQAKDLKSKRLK